jgi:peroxiredoxin
VSLIFPLLLSLTANAQAPGVGEPASLFSLPAINEATTESSGSRVSLAEITDNPSNRSSVVLYFFAKESGGAGLSQLNSVYNSHRRDGLQVFGVNVDQGELGELSNWIEGQGLDFPVLRDNHRVVAARYGVAQLPMTFIIDQRGDLFAVGAPSAGQLESELEAELSGLLQ